MILNILDLSQALSLLVDYHYYGRWTSSVLNLLMYNVLGGGESHLYGVEGPLFYLRNGFNNFNFCFVLALLFLGILPIVRKKYVSDLLVVVLPIYIWLGFMSLQPHKEERYNYFCHFIYYSFFYRNFLYYSSDLLMSSLRKKMSSCHNFPLKNYYECG